MTWWIVRNVGPWIVVWAVFAYVCIALLELLVFGRFEPTNYVPGAIGSGIGFAFAQRVVSFPPTASLES
ncbi:hypothetical protein [Natronorubrum sp. DTA7]|uniref:hypothetical protein n=1 Tax=Natronorubrum sp. DTA7 TaxID=3447016 RepID=UPI003F859D0A